MSERLIVSVCIALCMAACAIGAQVATPTDKSADLRPAVNLGRLIPAAFGHWRVDDTVAPVQVAPAVQARLNDLYSQTLSRTYVNQLGQRVMLVLAYGGDQRDSLAIHMPEVCYAAQGFDIVRNQKARFDTGFGAIPVSQLVARQPRRYEPITYWIRVGDSVDGTGLRRKLTQIKYGMGGLIPDGMLFRVSSIGPDEQAFALQSLFTRDLLAAIDGAGRSFLLGSQTNAILHASVAPGRS